MSDIESKRDLEEGVQPPVGKVESEVVGEKSPNDPGNKGEDNKSDSHSTASSNAPPEEELEKAPSSCAPLWYTLAAVAVLIGIIMFWYCTRKAPGVKSVLLEEPVISRTEAAKAKSKLSGGVEPWYYTNYESKKDKSGKIIGWVPGKPQAFGQNQITELTERHTQFVNAMANASTDSVDVDAWVNAYKSFDYKFDIKQLKYSLFVVPVLAEGKKLKYVQFKRIKTTNDFNYCWIVTPPQAVTNKLKEIEKGMELTNFWRTEYYGFYGSKVQEDLTSKWNAYNKMEKLDQYLKRPGRFAGGFVNALPDALNKKFKKWKHVCQFEIENVPMDFHIWVTIKETARFMDVDREIILKQTSCLKGGKAIPPTYTAHSVYGPKHVQWGLHIPVASLE